jgi:hypothetical protein
VVVSEEMEQPVKGEPTPLGFHRNTNCAGLALGNTCRDDHIAEKAAMVRYARLK